MRSKSEYLSWLGLSALLFGLCPSAYAQAGHEQSPPAASAPGAASAQQAADSLPSDPTEFVDRVKQLADRPIDLSHFVVNEEDPESNLPTPEEAAGRPVAFAEMTMEIAKLAEQARERGDWARALKFDRVIVRFTQDKALGYTKLCQDLEKLGKRDEAVKLCGAALQLEGVRLEDFSRFVALVLSRPQGLDPVELDDAKAAVDHLKAADSSRLLGYQLQCQVALAAKDDALFEQCANELIKLAPTDRKSIGAAWTLALRKQDFARAHELLDAAPGAGMSSEELRRMQELTDEKEAEGSLLKSLSLKAGHPMFKYMLALIAALAAGVFASRKLARTRSA